ncbi:MAG: AmmeMemoRadiSam system protein B [Patescibacteria group bacterium]
MINFAAIVPHPPFLIPNVGKNHLPKLKKTLAAFELLEKKLQETHIDTIIMISPHGDLANELLAINTRQNYEINFEKFGDFATKMEIEADLGIINKLKSSNETYLPIQLFSEQNLDHGISVPLFHLLKNKKNYRLVPINYNTNDQEMLFAFGEALKEASFDSPKRVAIILSGDLSHRLAYDSPHGFSPQAKEFDKKIIQLLKKNNLENFKNIDGKMIQEALPCLFPGLYILLGALAKMNCQFEILNYEAPFGVGYLLGNFNFNG